MTANQSGTTAALVPPKILSGKEIYDVLMREIEPELLSDNLPRLKEQSSHDTPEQMRERALRYEKAFAEYDKRFQKYAEDLHAKVVHYRKQALHSVEAQDRSREEISINSRLGSFFGIAT